MTLFLLPVLTQSVLALALGNLWPAMAWRKAWLRSLVLCGVLMTLGTELLSWGRLVTRIGLTLLWLVPLLCALGWLAWRSRRQALRWPRFPRLRGPLLVVLAAMVMVALVLTGIVAWLSPVQTWDSLTYHMSRVAHWAQNQSLAPYATGIERQIYMPPGAEIGVLQTYVLAQSDRPVNMVSWFAILSCAVTGSLIARSLGAGRSGQWLAAALVVSLPMAIAQASSTMTDLVTAAWVLAVAAETVDLGQEGKALASVIFASAGAGMAANTKPTAYVFLLPFAIWMGLRVLRHCGWRHSLALALLAILIFSSLLAPHALRNLEVYGSWLGDPDRVSTHANRTLAWQALASNLLRNASQHAGTPWPAVNDFIARGVIKAHLLMDFPLNDPGVTSHGRWEGVGKPAQSDSMTGNTLFALLLLLSCVLMLFTWRRIPRVVYSYALAVILGFVLYALVFQWQAFGSRLQLPFFVVAAPMVAAVAAGLLSAEIVAALGVAAVLLAWPWYLRLDGRPLLPEAGRQGILTRDRNSLTFARAPSLAVTYATMAEVIGQAGCQEIAIMLSGDGAEYPLWPLLGAPNPDLRIEWLVAGSPSSRYATPLNPCAVVCADCAQDQDSVRGLGRVYQQGRYSLYLDR